MAEPANTLCPVSEELNRICVYDLQPPIALSPVQTQTHSAQVTMHAEQFALPTGGWLVLPCAVLHLDDRTSDACRGLGGRDVGQFAGTEPVFFPLTDTQPSGHLPGVPVVAYLVGARGDFLVDGNGFQGAPLFLVCPDPGCYKAAA